MKGIKVLVVDDERPARLGMRRALEGAGFSVAEASGGTEAIEKIRAGGIDLVFMDIAMPEMDGLTALDVIVDIPGGPPTVMVTAHGNEKVAVSAIKRGAWDYLGKPYDVEELRQLARNAGEKILLARENRRLRDALQRAEGLGRIHGESQAIRNLLRLIDKVGPTDATVLITGESGTGKELVATRLHALSQRSEKPFVSMNCAALPSDLIETELFGHEKGAFTGAVDLRRGKFELANGGTLLLDEVGDMSLTTQAKLLRVLQEKRFHRVGGEDTIEVNVRVLSVTNQHLTKLIQEGRFREDLYYRLKVVQIETTPLRKRREDIPVLVRAFLAEFAASHDKPVRGIAPEALDLLVQSDWEGNVRQLRNTLESAVILSEGEVLDAEDFPELAECPNREGLTMPAGLPFREAKKRVIREFERRYIKSSLEESGGNISRAAESLGMHRQSLQQKMRDLGLRGDSEE